MVELGVWFVGDSNYQYPPGATWACVNDPSVTVPAGINKILDWLQVHLPWGNPFVTADQLNTVEAALKTVHWSEFYGTCFIAEEHDKTMIQFADDLNTFWFGEQVQGYPIWLISNPNMTRAQWQDDMMLRMLRGFTVYIHSQGSRVGQTMPNPSIIARPDWGVDYAQYYYGSPAYQYMRANFDFIIAYNYTTNLNRIDDSKAFYYYLSAAPTVRVQGMPEYYAKIDTDFAKQKKFWINTRIWIGDNDATWELEAVALEMKNALDRNMTIFYQDENPPLAFMWEYIQKSIQLYQANTPYYQSIVNGVNLLTGKTGDTYGWVDTTSLQNKVLTFSNNPSNGGLIQIDPFQGPTGYPVNTLVLLTAVPNSGFTFNNWLVDGNSLSGSTVSVLMDVNHTAIANYSAVVPPPPPPKRVRRGKRWQH